MLQTFVSILPIFLLILIGFGLKAINLLDASGWQALDRLSFYLLYPVLIFVTIIKADFSGIAMLDIVTSLGTPWALLGAGLMLAAPLLIARGLIAASQFSSIFQTTVRWNGFVALAIAERLLDANAAAIVALVMAALVLPINLVTIYVVTRYDSHGKGGLGATLRRMASNPIVLACIGALLLRALTLALPEPVMTTLDLISRGALALGLIGIGAGLQLAALFRPQWATFLPVGLKLLALPAMALATALQFGTDAQTLSTIVLCAAVPTAMNGYVVARQMGGDAPLYAAIVTIQTLLSFITIPVLLSVAQRFG
jgi:malonate transporter and related proteins